MTCKECIHEKVCDALIKSGCPYLDKEIPAEAFCLEFRNTADVVPKSEVYDDHHKQVACYTLGCREGDKIKQKVAREIFEEIDKAHDECIWIEITTSIGYFQQTKFEHKLAELKKKYT